MGLVSGGVRSEGFGTEGHEGNEDNALLGDGQLYESWLDSQEEPDNGGSQQAHSTRPAPSGKSSPCLILGPRRGAEILAAAAPRH